MPLFSIILPIKSLRDLNKTCLSSTLMQVCSECSLYIGVQEFCESSSKLLSYLSKFPNVKILESTSATNISENLNKIISSASTSQKVVRLDADDNCHPNRIRLLIENEALINKCSIVAQPARYLSSGKLTNTLQVGSHNSAINKASLAISVPFAHPSITINTEKVNIPLYDVSYEYAQDYKLYVDNIESGPYISIPWPGIYYSIPSTNSDSYLKKRKKQLSNHDKIMTLLWSKVF